MADNENVVELDLDVGKIDGNLKDIAAAVKGLGSGMTNLSLAMTGGFLVTQGMLAALSKSFDGINKILSAIGIKNAIEAGTDRIVEEIKEVCEEVEDLAKQQEQGGKVDTGFNVANTAIGIIGLANNLRGKSSKSGNHKEKQSEDSDSGIIVGEIVSSVLTNMGGKTSGQLALPPGGTTGRLALPAAGQSSASKNLASNTVMDMSDELGLIVNSSDEIGEALVTMSTSGTSAGTAIKNAFSSVGTALSGLPGKITAAFSGASTWLTGTLMPAIGGALDTIGGAVNLSGGWVGLIIAAVAAAIALVITYWDEIVAFFTVTLPELWNKFVEWIGGIASGAAEMFSNAMAAVGSFFTDLWNGVVSVWNNMASALGQVWNNFAAGVENVLGFIQGLFQGVDDFLQNVFAKDWTEQFGAFGNVLNAFFANFENIWNAIKSIFDGIVTFVRSVFAGDWKKAWSGIVDIFSGVWDGLKAAITAPINLIIGVINGMISAVADGINFIIKAVNKLSFTVPDFVPVIGGEEFGFNLKTVTAPQIPLLAQGAVLPANKPFLAVVGDQRHGTNIEAPLATIQEAVALVMEDQTSAILAGFEASVSVQREILEAVLGIQIGDAVIARAADRYRSKMAVVRGGLF